MVVTSVVVFTIVALLGLSMAADVLKGGVLPRPLGWRTSVWRY
jgi:hypothetical protein